jgi:hypothetical protein
MIDDLLALAERLARMSPNRPKQAELRRAVSTAYYALFHAMAKNCSDCLVGTTKAARPNRAWGQTYRALDHGPAKTACEGVRKIGFPQEICVCADAFVELQKARHDADYDPHHRLTRAVALEAVERAREGVEGLRHAGSNDRRAFAVHVLMKRRG